MLRLRKRGRIWYCGGTVKVGQRTLVVDEHSTGFADKASAETYKATYQAEKQGELLHGIAFVRSKVTFADAAVAYLQSSPHLSDVSRVRQLAQEFDGTRLADIDAAAFAKFTRNVLPGRAPNTLERVRGTLAAIFAAVGARFPDIPSYGETLVRIKWLPHHKAQRLINLYAPHVQPIALVARDCGLRASESLLMTVDRCLHGHGSHGGFLIQDPKNGRDRVVPWTADVRVEILKHIAGKEGRESLWLNRYRVPYSDTRRTGGNPLSKAHRAACTRAGVTDFTWHDWRHHWATWALQPVEKGGFGWDIMELQRVGGWHDLTSVQKYAAAMDESVNEKMENTGTKRAVV